jgi:hypothetical protein
MRRRAAAVVALSTDQNNTSRVGEQSLLRLSVRPPPPNDKLSLSRKATEAETDARARGEVPFDRLQPNVGLVDSI